ncbi:hypothetical protein Tco_0199443 [Tanacetum coccineum]
MSSARIEHIKTQRIINAIEAIAICKAKIRIAHDSMDQVVQYGGANIPFQDFEDELKTVTKKNKGSNKDSLCNNNNATKASLKPWDDKEPFTRKLTWVCIDGLPIQGKHNRAIKPIVNKLGRILEIRRVDLNSKLIQAR